MAVGVGEGGIYRFGYAPCREGIVGSAYAAGEAFERAVAAVYQAQAAQVVAEVAPEERTVEIAVGNGVDIALHHKAVWLAAESREHALGIAQYHRTLSPGDGRNQERGYLGIALLGEAPGELHRVVGYESGGVVALGQSVEQLLYIFVIVDGHN